MISAMFYSLTKMQNLEELIRFIHLSGARERKEIRFATSTVQGLKQARKLRKNQNSVLRRYQSFYSALSKTTSALSCKSLWRDEAVLAIRLKFENDVFSFV